MTSLLTALLITHVSPLKQPANTVSLTSEEDVWVYTHSNDPGNHPYMLVWGVGGTSVAPTPGDTENYSYGYLKFNLSEVPKDKKLVSATLYLTPSGKPVVNEAAKEWPLEVRGLVGNFSEKTWTWEKSSEVNPSKELLFGSGVIAKTGEEFSIKVDLLAGKSKFAETLSKIKGEIYFGLTSRYDVADMGREGIYRISTRDNKDKNVHPRLELKFE